MNGRPIKPIALRLTDHSMAERVQDLSVQHGLSLNITVNMLLGYAFNKVDEEGKEFTPVTVFETKEGGE
ncbi:hypothetical protein RER_24780 [Rhodococcus erythropolis PR4]|uniref:Uncharacterized protein n=2 Tax=Rhodococcus erythropolis TaxID=1833 RepID=C0ZXV1_RHOE4|nr:hypothetical protein RER_24780 [Rhodococcus erythropolis PR4]